MPRGRAIALRGALVLASVFFAFAVCELGLRVHLWWTQGFDTLERLQASESGERIRTHSEHALVAVIRLSTDKRLIYELRPGMDKTFGGKRVRSNSAGMRTEREFAREKPPGILRIVGVGDSGMWGWAVDQGEAYLDRLQKRLGPEAEVLNLAVPGYDTQQEVEMLRARGLGYAPDVVVLGWCDNDFAPPPFLHHPRRTLTRRHSYLWALAFDRARFRRIAQPNVVHLDEIDRSLADPEVLSESGPEGVKRQLVALRELARERGFHLLVFGSLGIRVLEILHDVGVDFVNLRDDPAARAAPRAQKTLGCHPRPEGHALAAEILERELARRGWLLGPSRQASGVVSR